MTIDSLEQLLRERRREAFHRRLRWLVTALACLGIAAAAVVAISWASVAMNLAQFSVK